MSSDFFKLNGKDISKALVMAIISGAILPIAAAIQTPEFSVTAINWHAIGMLALNGAVVGFISYIAKNLVSDSDGKVFGKIG